MCFASKWRSDGQFAAFPTRVMSHPNKHPQFEAHGSLIRKITTFNEMPGPRMRTRSRVVFGIPWKIVIPPTVEAIYTPNHM